MGVVVGHIVGGRPGPRLTDLVGRAGGNPLYARELADGLMRQGQIRVEAGAADLTGELAAGESALARVPESLAGAIAGRLAHLAEDVVTVLRWAAVLGHEFSVTDLQVVTRRPAGDLPDIIPRPQLPRPLPD